MTARHRPVIGIVAGTSDDPGLTICQRSYIDAVSGAGGCPIVLPHTAPESAPDLLGGCDGLLLPGGGDFDPAYFGAPPETAKLRRVDPPRDAFENAIIRAADRADMPLLGICRGMQWMAVTRGGTLHIDIASELPGTLEHAHWDSTRSALSHEVELDEGSRLAAIIGEARIRVNSRHHQAVARAGARVSVSAIAPDGVIEAIEWPDRDFAIGVQWHPEDLAARNDAASTALFASFVAAAVQYHARNSGQM